MTAVRVLWLTKGLGPGGTERLLVELARTMDRSHVDVQAAYVLAWKDHLSGELEASGVVTTCLSARRRDPLWAWRLRALLGQVDVVHAHAPTTAAAARVVARTLPRRRRPAVVVTEHNTQGSYRRPTRWINRVTSHRDAATWTVTEEARASLRGRRRSAPRCWCTGSTSRASGGATGDHGWRSAASSDWTTATSSSGRWPTSGRRRTTPTCSPRRASSSTATLAFRVVAVGQGPLESEITAQRDALGLSDHVVLTGFRPDAVDVLRACDGFVLASAWEGLPVAVMEATALGLPIVATRVGGVAEHLEDADAILVPPRDPSALADGLATIVSDTDRRAELAVASRAAAERFDIRRAAAVLTDRYRSLARAVEAPPADRPAEPPPRAPRPSPEIRPLGDADRDAVLELFVAALGWRDDDAHRSLLRWKHEDNPFGRSPGWVVEHGGEVVAVRLMMRWAFLRGGRVVRAVRAVDTATRPDHQGAGLFSALTQVAVAACRADGVAFVFNTPNEQSRPGYLKLGWRDVGRVPAAMRPRSPGQLPGLVRGRQPAELWSSPIDVGVDIGTWLDGGGWRWPPPGRDVSSTDRTLRTELDADVLRWRYGLPALHYRVVDDGDAAVVVRVRRRGAGRSWSSPSASVPLSQADRLAGRLVADVDATHALRLGAPSLRHGFLPLPGQGPRLHVARPRRPRPSPTAQLAVRARRHRALLIASLVIVRRLVARQPDRGRGGRSVSFEDHGGAGGDVVPAVDHRAGAGVDDVVG